ncbi:MAG: L,D-transpeptidase [Syntrophothermus sp.]
MSGRRAKAAFLWGVVVVSLVLWCSIASLSGAAKAGLPQNGQAVSEPQTGLFIPAENRGSAREGNVVDGNKDRLGDLALRREIVINVPAFTLYLYEEGRLIRQYPIAVGRMVTPSNFGEYRIINRVVNPTWYPEGREPVPPGPDNPVGTRWLGINLEGYGIHGTNDPSSIGKAVSKGCIRMRNEDVEELHDLVRIGTPVKLTYETIVIEPDREGKQYTITVYRDVYRKGTNTLGRAREKLANLARQGVRTTLGDERLSRILRAAAGRPEVLPVDVEVQVGETIVGRGAYWDGGRLWLPLRPVEEVLGRKAARYGRQQTAFPDGGRLEEVAAGGRMAAPLEEIEKSFGVHSTYDQRAGRVRLLMPVIYANGEPLGINGFWRKGMLYLPIFGLADRLGVEIGWDSEREQVLFAGSPVSVTLIDNTFYVPFYEVKDLELEVELQWEEV